MGIMDRLKKMTGTNDGYDDNYDDDYYDGFDNYTEDGDDSDVQFVPPTNQAQTQTQNVNMGSTAGSGISFTGANIKMQVVRPQSYDSDTTSQIANHLLNKCMVVLNLENTNKETSRRLIDFLTGVAYAIGGDLKKVSTNAYVIAPSNVDVENVQIKQTSRRTEPQPAPKENTGDDFGDFN
jgi:cell division inhibitor SepF